MDDGQVARRRDLTVGYLRQEVEEVEEVGNDAPLPVSINGSQGAVAASEGRLRELWRSGEFSPP